ncbi:MAG: hypothetical protein ACXWW2_04440 [Candidatus Deferrimicrobiaceae bacterium]
MGDRRKTPWLRGIVPGRGTGGSAGPLPAGVLSGIRSCRWNWPSGFDMMLLPPRVSAPYGTGGKHGKDGRSGMGFDPDMFLTRYADAFNARDPEKLRTFFALDDPRFAVFEDFSKDLFDGETYGAILEATFDASGEMSFELLRCDRFGDFAIVHSIQKIVDEEEEEGGVFAETLVRATMWVTVPGKEARVVVAHFSSLPSAASDVRLAGIPTG